MKNKFTKLTEFITGSSLPASMWWYVSLPVELPGEDVAEHNGGFQGLYWSENHRQRNLSLRNQQWGHAIFKCNSFLHCFPSFYEVFDAPNSHPGYSRHTGSTASHHQTPGSKSRDSLPASMNGVALCFRWTQPNLKKKKKHQICYEAELPFPAWSRYKQILREMGRVILESQDILEHTLFS